MKYRNLAALSSPGAMRAPVEMAPALTMGLCGSRALFKLTCKGRAWVWVGVVLRHVVRARARHDHEHTHLIEREARRFRAHVAVYELQAAVLHCDSVHERLDAALDAERGAHVAVRKLLPVHCAHGYRKRGGIGVCQDGDVGSGRAVRDLHAQVRGGEGTTGRRDVHCVRNALRAPR